MSKRGHQQLCAPQASYVATLDNRIPKCLIKIELMDAVDIPDNEVVMVARAKTQYLVYEDRDDIYYKALQLFTQISKKLGERNESQALRRS